MHIYLISKRKDLDEKDDPWYPWYDKQHRVVVRAENEVEARKLATRNCQDEGENAWLDSKYSKCEQIKTTKLDGRAIILRDIRNG